MKLLIFASAIVAVSFAADGASENWKVTACQRTNGKLSFCGDVDFSGDSVKDNTVIDDTSSPPVLPVRPLTTEAEVLESFPALDGDRNDGDDALRGGRVPDARCYSFQDRFYHYCLNITEQPQNIRTSLRESCARYRASCRGFITTISPIEELPAVTEAPPYVPGVCYHNCTEDHCTKRCKCDHYKPNWERTCKEDVMMPLWQQNCQIWYAACEEFYAIPPGYYTGKQVGNYGRVENTHTGFYEDKAEVDVDWAEGQVKVGDSWAVPAVGISGSTGVTDVRFPATLAGIGFGQLGRKKRSIFDVIRFKRSPVRKMKRSANSFAGWNEVAWN